MECLVMVLPLIGLGIVAPFILGLIYGFRNYRVDKRPLNYLLISIIITLLLTIIFLLISLNCIPLDSILRDSKPVFSILIVALLLSFFGTYMGLIIKKITLKRNNSI